MPVTRRSFLRLVADSASSSSLSGQVVAARGLEHHFAEGQAQGQGARPLLPPGVDEIRINSNENPLGPGHVALEAMVGKFPEANRYPFNSTPSETDLVAVLAKKYKVKPENVVVGAGSQEILKNSMRAFVTTSRGLVAASPTFENCPAFAKKYKLPLTEVKVDSAMRLDLGPMIDAAPTAGLVYICNPNNPTATVHGAKAITDMVERIRRASPDTAILIDEAYHDYVTDPGYQTAVPLALSTPNVFVARTFSKAYGMAGMRIGYAIGMPDTIKKLQTLKMPYNVSVLGIAAAVASLNDPQHIVDESKRNTAVREFTTKSLEGIGCKVAESQGNFLFADIGCPAKEFREACAKYGVMVGRDFPPFEKSYSRISLGTMDEMKKATDVFQNVLKTINANPQSGKGARS